MQVAGSKTGVWFWTLLYIDCTYYAYRTGSNIPRIEQIQAVKSVWAKQSWKRSVKDETLSSSKENSLTVGHSSEFGFYKVRQLPYQNVHEYSFHFDKQIYWRLVQELLTDCFWWFASTFETQWLFDPWLWLISEFIWLQSIQI